jgi:glycerophosphoryl diester phosphodiesterase
MTEAMTTEIAPAPPAWTGPRWIAHRGAGKLAPENTLAAFRLGAALGWRAYECDVKLSADGVPFLLHDATLERTVDATSAGLDTATVAGSLPWSALSRLDAGRWHGRAFAGEPLPTLEAIAAWCLANGHALNIEIKPTPGEEVRTGAVVAAAVQRLWTDAVAAGDAAWPLLSSFRPESLAAALQDAPGLPRALLLDSLWDDCLGVAERLGCGAVVLNHLLVDAPPFVHELHARGLQALVYTVNDAERAAALLAWGIDAVITDAVDRFVPD